MAGRFDPVSGYGPNLALVERTIAFDASISIQNTFAVALARGIEQESDAFVNALARSLQNVRQSRGLFTEANRRLASNMQNSMLRSYDQTVTARKQYPSYRVGEPSRNGKYAYGRFSGGKLRNALSNRDMVIATPQGIAYINNEILDREAVHWARLNYGAGAAGGKAARAFNWTFRGQTLGTINLPWAPSRGFKMPHGVWDNGFYPRSKVLNVFTKGIKARRFFDAGIARFVRDFPVVYDSVLDNLINQGIRGVGPLAGEHQPVRAKVLYMLRGL